MERLTPEVVRSWSPERIIHEIQLRNELIREFIREEMEQSESFSTASMEVNMMDLVNKEEDQIKNLRSEIDLIQKVVHH